MPDPRRDRLVYKIVPAALWAASRATGRFEGSPVDRQDGFIHFSAGSQVRETAARHFAREDGLLLVAVRAEMIALRWEPSRGGDRFPHLYGALPLDAVAWVKPLPLAPDGQHEFPELD
jgi:uncharacterized protein (DUF952 family)